MIVLNVYMDHFGGAMFSLRKIVGSIPGRVKSKII